jgi:large subunit ribosomal protein L4
MMAQATSNIFNEELNEAVVHEALRWYLASQRRGTHSALTRTEVTGGGKKPWKQKGTGRARAGSNRSPLWRKGGVIFPPKPRDYSYALPKKMRRLALRVALSALHKEGRVKIIEAFALAETKTKAGVKFLKEQGVSGATLVILAESKPEFAKGVRNIAGVSLTLAKDLNIYELLKAEWALIEQPAVALLEKGLL